MPGYLKYPQHYLNLHYTLTCGQAFRWKVDCDGWWSAAVLDSAIRIKEADSGGFFYETIGEQVDETLIRQYFRLDEDIEAIYRRLAESGEPMVSLLKQYSGLRLLRQPPEETLLSYICSTANSLPRISRAIEELSCKYGHFITEAGGREHYAFPTAAALASANPDDLANTAGLGWRGPNVGNVAQQLISHTDGWLDSLRSVSYEQAKKELLTLRGVGNKIADCVCLFALDKDEAAPIDTHIYQVAVRLFGMDLGVKTLTPAVYERISRLFRERFGKYAGWAQEFLYYEDVLRGRRVVS